MTTINKGKLTTLVARIRELEAENAGIRRKALEEAEARTVAENMDGLLESQYRAGVKAGWNMGVVEDSKKFQKTMAYEGHLASTCSLISKEGE